MKSAMIFAVLAAGASAHWSDPLYLEGRHEVRGDTLVFNWNGFKIAGEFNGTRVGLHMRDAYHDYNVWIDGVLKTYADTGFKYLRPGATNFVWLDTNLNPGKHRFELQRRDEGGRAFIWGIDLGGGQLESISVRPSRKLEVFGDSFAASYGLESPSRNCTPIQMRSYSNSTLSYPVVLAAQQNAELHLQAVSGRGVVRSYGGADVPPMSDILFKIFPDTNVENYKGLREWKPGVVVLGLGTNDFSTPLGDDEKWTSAWELKAAFKERYHFMLDTLRKNYGGIPFVVMQQSTYSEMSAALSEIVAEQKAAGYANVHYIPLKGLELTACGWHASVKDHAKMATDLSHLVDSLQLWSAPLDTYHGTVVDVKVQPLPYLQRQGWDLILPAGLWDLNFRDVQGRLILGVHQVQGRVDLSALPKNMQIYLAMSQGDRRYFGRW